jgi:hypothetical protein
MATAAAGFLALALQIDSGHFHVAAVLLLGAAFVATTLAIRGARLRRFEALGGSAIELALGVAIAAALVAHFFRPPGIHLDITGFWQRTPFNLGLLGAGLLVAGAFLRPERAATARAPILLSLFFVLGAWVIHHSTDPQTDVILIQREAIATLLAGDNPYSMTFPNIYGANSPFYGPGMVSGDRVLYGYSYPPLLLLLALPGQVLAGDLRYSHLLALTIAGGLIAYARPGRVGSLAAALFLFAPRTYFVLEQSWTDCFVVMVLALLVFCACRWQRGFPVVLGLFLGAKQYIVLALPLLWLLRPQLTRSPGLKVILSIAVMTAAVVTLPLALWDFSAFWRDLIVIQFQLPFRMDSLSFSAALARLTGIKLPSLVGFLAAGAAMVVALRRCPVSPSGFALGLTWVYFAFFAFNRQAFCNYYFLILGALCISLGARRPGSLASPLELSRVMDPDQSPDRRHQARGYGPPAAKAMISAVNSARP